MAVNGGRDVLMVVFTDMVGSTAFRQMHGDRVADEAQRHLDEIHTELCAAHGGEIVKHLGDGMMLVFRSAVAALQFCAGVQTEVDLLTARFGHRLQMRIGVSIGEVMAKDGDYFGMAPIEASRLCALAQPEQILVSDIVTQVLRGLHDIALVDPTPYDCKGIDQPVIAWTLPWAAPVQGHELPSELRADPRFGFVGRSAEVDRLMAGWRAVRGGSAHLSVISGVAGLGKTQLAAEVARRAHADGALVLFGRHDEDIAVPYQATATMLRQFIADQPHSTLARRLGKHRGDLVRLVPELAELVAELPPVTRGDPETERQALSEAVIDWLREISSIQPVVLVLDDIQWSGPPTLQLWRTVLGDPRTTNVWLVATSRVSALTPPLPLLVGSLPTSQVTTIELQPFDDVTTLAFLEQAAGQDLGDDGRRMAEYLVRQSGGNPFFAREITLHLVEQGAMASVDGVWRTVLDPDSLTLPEGVHRVVAERISRLPEPSQRVLSWAAVIGLQVELGLLAAVTEIGADRLLDHLDPCLEAGLLLEEGIDRFAFSHTLVRQSLYESMSPTRRVRSHRRVATAIEAMDESARQRQLSALAHHIDEGRTDDDVAIAIRYRRMAGEQALTQLSATVAATHFERAVALFDSPGGAALDPRDRVATNIRLGQALLESGSPRFEAVMLDAVRAASALRDGELLGTALLMLAPASAQRTGAVGAERLAQLQQAVEWMPAGDSALKARVLASSAAELHFSGDIERIQRLADEALAMARRVGDENALNDVLVLRLAALRFPSLVEIRRSDAIELQRMALASGDVPNAFMATYRRLDAEIELANGTAARTAAGLLEELYARNPTPFLQLMLSRVRTDIAWLDGDLHRALHLLDEGWEQSVAFGHAPARLAARVGLGEKILGALGRHDDVVELWQPLMVEAYASLAAGGIGVALAHLDAGHLDEAQRLYRLAAESRFETIGANTAEVNNLAFASVLCLQFGDSDDAAILRHRLTPFEPLVAQTAGSAGAVVHFLGLLDIVDGRFDDALARFDTASERNAGLRAPVLEAYNQIARAAALQRRNSPGDADRVATIVADVRELAERVDGRGIIARLERWLGTTIKEPT